jgi:hypothetical protein
MRSTPAVAMPRRIVASPAGRLAPTFAGGTNCRALSRTGAGVCAEAAAATPATMQANARWRIDEFICGGQVQPTFRPRHETSRDESDLVLNGGVARRPIDWQSTIRHYHIWYPLEYGLLS